MRLRRIACPAAPLQKASAEGTGTQTRGAGRGVAGPRCTAGVSQAARAARATRGGGAAASSLTPGEFRKPHRCHLNVRRHVVGCPQQRGPLGLLGRAPRPRPVGRRLQARGGGGGGAEGERERLVGSRCICTALVAWRLARRPATANAADSVRAVTLGAVRAATAARSPRSAFAGVGRTHLCRLGRVKRDALPQLRRKVMAHGEPAPAPAATPRRVEGWRPRGAITRVCVHGLRGGSRAAAG